jgi:hypothetical protein
MFLDVKSVKSYVVGSTRAGKATFTLAVTALNWVTLLVC